MLEDAIPGASGLYVRELSLSLSLYLSPFLLVICLSLLNLRKLLRENRDCWRIL